MAGKTSDRLTVNELYLQTAEEVGHHLIDAAAWYGGRCNWLTPEVRLSDRGWDISYESLDGNLYQGTSGVALFLAELARIDNNPMTRRTALGAIAQALESPASSVPGLYTGRWGIAIAAARIAHSLGNEEVAVQASRLMREAMVDGGERWDLVSGRAGEIIAFLCLARMCAQGHWIGRAHDLAEHLLRAGRRRKEGLTWPPQRPHRRPLLGLSHGNAGVALAFLRLYEVSGDRRFQRAAEDAILYEDAFYDEVRRNWPDLRHARGRRPSLEAPFATTWCHGAPGIAISRMHAARLFEDVDIAIDRDNAIATTTKSIQATLGSEGGNYSLCHGLSGNADILLSSGSVEVVCLAREVGDVGLSRYRKSGDWPCGLPGAGTTPGLFLGLAGIGYFFLRLTGGNVPSVLDLDPEQLIA